MEPTGMTNTDDPDPVVLPIATRAWVVRDRLQTGAALPSKRRRPGKFIAVRGAETALERPLGVPAAMSGVARIGYLLGEADYQTAREILFYNPVTAPPEAIEALHRFVADNTMRRGSGPKADLVWRDEPSVKVDVKTLDEFLRTFFAIATDKERAVVITHDALATFGALARRWGRAKAKPHRPFRRDKWSLTLAAQETDPRTGQPAPEFMPRILIDHIGDAGIDIPGFGTVRKGCRPATAEVLDCAALAYALSGDRGGFAGDVETFAARFMESRRGELLDAADATPAGLREQGRALVALAQSLVGYFDVMHPGLSRSGDGRMSESKAFGPGSIARAYAATAGYAAPKVPPEMVGLSAEANHGAWAGIGVRGRVPIVEVDFRRQYATIFTRQQIGELLAAERLEFVEATDEIREAVKTMPATLGPALNAICLIHPRGEPLMVRALFKETDERGFDAEDFTLAMTPRWSKGPIPKFLADVITARELCGFAPEIIKAWKIVPANSRDLREIAIFGRYIDPAATSIPAAIAEESERLKQGAGRFAAIPQSARDALVNGAKMAGNIFSYGMLLQTYAIDLPAGTHEEVTLLHAGGSMRRTVSTPEEDSLFTCVPLAGLVAASGRLLLARVHRAVKEKGGVIACWDTDSAHICATEAGGTMEIETRAGERGAAPLKREKIRLLSWREVDEIIAIFDEENPFDRSILPGSALRLTGENFDAGSRRALLEGVFISQKRYCLIAPGGRLIDTMASSIGAPLPPVGDFVNERAWRWLVEEFAKAPIIFSRAMPEWAARPMVRELVVSTPDIAAALAGRKRNGHASRPAPLPGLWPGMRYLASEAEDVEEPETKAPWRAIVAPLSRDPARWDTLPWRFFDSGEPLDRERIRTWEHFMRSYLLHPTPSMLGPDGEPWGPFTRGVLRPRPMSDGRHWYVLKEGVAYGDDPEHAFDVVPGELIEGDALASSTIGPDDPGSVLWEDAIRPALKIVRVPAVAAWMGVSERAVRLWAGGYRFPTRPLLEVAQAVARAGYDQGLCAAGGDDIARCRNMPFTHAAAARFNAMAAAVLAARFGGRAALAERLGVSRQTVDRTIDERSKPVDQVADFLDHLGRLAREMLGAAAVRRIDRSGDLDSGLCGARQVVAACLARICGVKSPPLLNPREALELPGALMNKINLPPEKEPTSRHWLAAMSHIKPWFNQLSRNPMRRLHALAAE
jgi:hypothetical protein